MTTNSPEAQPQEVELLPCPFCGRESLIEEFRDEDDPQPLFVATCEVCPIKTYDQFSAQDAARIWNTRANDRFRDLCRSALAIAKREGNATNWEAFVKQLEKAFRTDKKKEHFDG